MEDYVVFNNSVNDYIRVKVIKEDSKAFDMLFEIKGIKVDEHNLDDDGNMEVIIDYDLIDEASNVILDSYVIDQDAINDLGECVISMIEDAIKNENFNIEEGKEIDEQQSEKRVSSSSDSSESGSE
jgi:hypothetical protein